MNYFIWLGDQIRAWQSQLIHSSDASFAICPTIEPGPETKSPQTSILLARVAELERLLSSVSSERDQALATIQGTKECINAVETSFRSAPPGLDLSGYFGLLGELRRRLGF